MALDPRENLAIHPPLSVRFDFRFEFPMPRAKRISAPPNLAAGPEGDDEDKPKSRAKEGKAEMDVAKFYGSNNPRHPPYAQMVVEAVAGIKSRSGSTRQAVLGEVMGRVAEGADRKRVNALVYKALLGAVGKGQLEMQGSGSGARFTAARKKADSSAEEKKRRRRKVVVRKEKAKLAAKRGPKKKKEGGEESTLPSPSSSKGKFVHARSRKEAKRVAQALNGKDAAREEAKRRYEMDGEEEEAEETKTTRRTRKMGKRRAAENGK